MSGKRRNVVIPVTDDTVDTLVVEPTHRGVARGHTIAFPVPVDDQLTRKIDGVTKLAASKVAEYEAVGLPVPEWLAERARDAADVRAAFSLGAEDEPDEKPSLDNVLAHGRARFNLGTEEE